MGGLSYREYLEFYQREFGHKPKPGLLKRHYPDEFREEDAEPEEIHLPMFTPVKIDMLFGGELEG